jgi:hypothetical protein
VLIIVARSSWSENCSFPFPDRVALLVCASRDRATLWLLQEKDLTLTGTLCCRRQWSALVKLGVTQVKEIGVVVNPLSGVSPSLCSVLHFCPVQHACMGFTVTLWRSGSAPRRAQDPRQFGGTAMPPCPS